MRKLNSNAPQQTNNSSYINKMTQRFEFIQTMHHQHCAEHTRKSAAMPIILRHDDEEKI
jgi:hypothetical protein